MNIEELILHTNIIIEEGLDSEDDIQLILKQWETAYEKEKEKNKELSNSYDKLAKECNEENRRCMLLAVENQDFKEKNKELEKRLEEINNINFPTIN